MKELTPAQVRSLQNQLRSLQIQLDRTNRDLKNETRKRKALERELGTRKYADALKLRVVDRA